MQILGYYVTCDDALCVDCFVTEHGDDDGGAPDSIGFDGWHAAGGFEDWSEPAAILSGEEMDSPTHCKRCECLIPDTLTSEGYESVAEAIEDALRGDSRKCIVRSWAEAFAEGIERERLAEIVTTLVGTWPERDEFSPPNAG